MLAALGGRNAWARLRTTINASQQNRVGEPTVIHTVITLDFTCSGFWIETTIPGLHLIRESRIEDVPADVLLKNRRW